MTQIFEVEFYGEVCCEECNEIIHNHFDCPVCKTEYAGTSLYGEVSFDTTFNCEKCGTEFKSLDGEYFSQHDKNPVVVE